MPERMQTGHHEGRQNTVSPLSSLCPSLRSKRIVATRKNAKDLFAGWEIRCEAVQELVPARCIFCPLKHPENKQAGIWERQKDSESLHPSGPLSHLHTVFHIHGILCKRQRVWAEAVLAHSSQAMMTHLGEAVYPLVSPL